MNCQPKNIKITGASVFLKLVERNAKATISSLQFLRWWAEALCVEMGFMQTLLRKQNATAEIKVFFVIFLVFLSSTIVTYVIHRSLNQSKTLFIHKKYPRKTHFNTQWVGRGLNISA